MEQQHGESLKRGLKNRHIQLIALGGAVGTGLFLGSASVIKSAGPAVILGYAIAGFIAFLIMRQLGEMVVEEPVAGSFSHFAYKYWGNFAGFASGWNYWVLYVLVAMAELSAVGKYIQFWWPDFPTWASAAIFFVLINAVNLTNVKVFGEMEFWFAIIKVIAVIAMILFGGWLLFSGTGGPQATVRNLWEQGGFMPNGLGGLVMVMAIIMFSFGGLELVGITAAEADNPETTIPKATNQVLWRILIFYIGSLAVLLSLMPWTRVTAETSPFVFIFHELGDAMVANALNVVILTAALSVYNSCVYCNSRMLFGLAQQGNAPKALLNVDRRGVPVMSILVSAVATALCVLLNFLMPAEAFGLLMSLVVSALVINWAMISLAHLKFRKKKNQQGVTTRFKAVLYPLGNWICLVFLAGILVLMAMTPGMAISVWLIPVWLIVLAIGYFVKNKTQKA
ncbi:aromatic amino acid transport protein AroP [Pantoea sp. PA1]|jgi:aromatic amino acid transport protein AroP|uniref:Aromatic amino acid transport protein AroP n=1 Tax=Pantoea ananatis (strain AJ13355) TaxID=932677 RepID=A0A0H3KT04_PANAA|nr:MULTISPECIES: aromatic amino acid transporter AroP [Pantoea]AER33949.1 aromatic amino acid transport protein AroP [Pantoea ananatis PA13]ASN16441.1 aromatic amino acid transporter AroP [Pantoea ananatis]AVG75816.1 aromatic amino acid transporter AroP [Pantoea ananatis]ERM15157.1 aromatic amino acid transporter [Pantoea ananatis BRT175]KNA29878.1 aromatic amino acid transporter [Pantoea ananatis]